MTKMIIGLDIGIASVGWAVIRKGEDKQKNELEQGKIIDLGVRCFDKAEHPKTGEPLNLARRLHRSTRRRWSHRAQRLQQLRFFLQQQGLIDNCEAHALATPAHSPDPWALRVKGLDQKLTNPELARVIYHLVKHRGYYVARKIEEDATDKSEQGRMNLALKETAKFIEEQHYRSVAEMITIENAKKQEQEKMIVAKRNKAGDYKNTFYRKKLKEELTAILQKQQSLGNSLITDAFIHKIVEELFWFQRPAISGEAILKMLGFCTHEPSEYRAAKHSYSAERFVWLSSLNNLRINELGGSRSLTEEERTALINLPYKQEKITYKTIRKILKKLNDFPAENQFVGLSGRTEEELAKAENKTFFHSKGYHELRKAFSETRWQQIGTNTALLDQLATILTLYKTDADIEQHLRQHELDEQEIHNLLKVSFSAFNHLSLKALTKLLPYLEKGDNYYQACQQCHYHHQKNLPKQKYLPSLYQYEFDQLSKKVKRIPQIKNPVVMRALNQARKVLNAIIRQYGSPHEIHIELARDMSKTVEERKKMERQQDLNRELKQELSAEIEQKFKRKVKGVNLLKYRLYKEQDGKCPYSQEKIDINKLFDDGYVEIDHILPYSRSFDNSLSNKVLVINEQNQNKKNLTPYEYLHRASDSQMWQKFVDWVQSNPKLSRAKKERLLRKNFGETAASEFAQRNLNDTRYITRFFAQFIRDYLQFSVDGENKQESQQNVITHSGGITGFLRAIWGMVKEREKSDLHHALDACVIAATTPALIHRVTDYAKKNTFCSEWSSKDFPQPWPEFSDEVLARLDNEQSKNICHPFDKTTEPTQPRPVFVSRMPKRRNGGALHQETIRSAKFMHNEQSAVRKPLTSLKLTDLEKIVGYYLPDGETPDPRNQPLIEGLRARLQAHQGNAKKAFAEPFYKPTKEGKISPLVRTVKVLDVQKGGVLVRGGIADQDSMYRVDVFEKNGKYYLVPIYQIDRQPHRPLPNAAAVANKSRKDWLIMDETYQFKFSLSANDVVYLKRKNDEYFGYFAGLNIASAAITIRSHDRNIHAGKNGEWGGLGVIRNIEKFEKWHVDMLGRCYPAKAETRRGAA